MTTRILHAAFFLILALTLAACLPVPGRTADLRSAPSGDPYWRRTDGHRSRHPDAKRCEGRDSGAGRFDKLSARDLDRNPDLRRAARGGGRGRYAHPRTNAEADGLAGGDHGGGPPLSGGGVCEGCPIGSLRRRNDGSGSGFLVDGGYLITNAHIVWPYDKAGVVSPDGSGHEDVPVRAGISWPIWLCSGRWTPSSRRSPWRTAKTCRSAPRST